MTGQYQIMPLESEHQGWTQRTYVLTSFKSFRDWDDLKDLAEFLPRADVLHVRPVYVVELLRHSIPEELTCIIPFLVVSTPTEKVTHPIELKHHRIGWIV